MWGAHLSTQHDPSIAGTVVTLLLAYHPFGTGNPKCLGSTPGLFLRCLVAEVFLFGTSNPAEPRAVGTGSTTWVNGSDGRQDTPASTLQLLGPWMLYLFIKEAHIVIYGHTASKKQL